MQISSTKQAGPYRQPATILKNTIEAALSQTQSPGVTGKSLTETSASPDTYNLRAQSRQMTEDLVTFEDARNAVGREDATVGDVIGRLSEDIRGARNDAQKAHKAVENHDKRAGVALIGAAGLTLAGAVLGLTGQLSTGLSVGLAGAGSLGLLAAGFYQQDDTPQIVAGAMDERVQRLESAQDNMQMWVRLSAEG